MTSGLDVAEANLSRGLTSGQCTVDRRGRDMITWHLPPLFPMTLLSLSFLPLNALRRLPLPRHFL